MYDFDEYRTLTSNRIRLIEFAVAYTATGSARNGVRNCEIHIQWLACRTISASAELLASRC